MKYLVLILLTSFSFATNADTHSEISYLLAYVESTECKYERNGKSHTGKEAVKHIQKKYDYFKKDIVSTEDFIKYSATKSKMSGKYESKQSVSEKNINLLANDAVAALNVLHQHSKTKELPVGLTGISRLPRQ